MQNKTSSHEPAISEFFDGCPVPAFAINADHVITHWNKACEYLFDLSSVEMVGTRNQWRPIYRQQRPVLADLIVSGDLEDIHGIYYSALPF
jgi:two-component system NtrC family sensor kinase